MPLTTSLSEAVSGCDVHQRERTEDQVNIHSCECSSGAVVHTRLRTHCTQTWVKWVEVGGFYMLKVIQNAYLFI